MSFERGISAALAAAATASLPGAGVSRLPFTRQHRQAIGIIRGWMETAGMTVRLDDAGTLVGRIAARRKNAPVLLVGSHQDSVINGGRYDGIMGVLLPIMALQALAREGVRLPYSVDCLAFADEEGVRFPTALMGSRALAGTFDTAALGLQDGDGVSLRAAMCAFGLRPEKIKSLRRDPAAVIGYVETHIEQGPVLENAGQALGVVSAICGIERWRIDIRGAAAHAGTTPSPLRRDALAAAAELVSGVEHLTLADKDASAIVGRIVVHPNVANVVPGHAALTVEIRASCDRARRRFAAAVRRLCADLQKRRRVRVIRRRTYAQPATVCDKRLSAHLAAAVTAVGQEGVRLPSGATHDASAMADLCPIAMLFVRCKAGVSHRPNERAGVADMALATRALKQFFVNLAAE